MRFGVAVMALGASLAIISASAATAYAAQTSGTPTGNDVSYPQCGKALPLGQAFGIVGVNDGLANNTSPCLTAEINWARSSSGTTSQPKASLYVNTANPGNLGVADWPANNSDPVTGNRVTGPYGNCTGGDNQACAWQYGWDMADLDAHIRGVPNPGSYRWWLDAETASSWESSTQNNRADLEGMVAYFHSIGASVGVYSPAGQWARIAGSVPPGSPLYTLPDWLPGVTTLLQAKANCGSAPLTGAGTIAVTQWTSSTADGDFSCR